VLAPYEFAIASDGKDDGVSAEYALSRRCASAAAALRHMLPHMHQQVPTYQEAPLCNSMEPWTLTVTLQP
jgi:hypothetical protein